MAFRVEVSAEALGAEIRLLLYGRTHRRFLAKNAKTRQENKKKQGDPLRARELGSFLASLTVLGVIGEKSLSVFIFGTVLSKT